MADKTIGELDNAPELYDDSLMIIEQQGQAMNLTGEQFKTFAQESIAGQVATTIKNANISTAAAQRADENALKVDAAWESIQESEAAVIAAQHATEEARDEALASLDTKQDKALVFYDTAVESDAWSYDGTYTDFPYVAALELEGVTEDRFASVVFPPDIATSGAMAPVCETYDGGVYIYASDGSHSLTIPTIICM